MTDKTIFVVVRNDYPHAWAPTEEAAAAYCKRKNAADTIAADRENRGRRYYRWHEVEVLSDA